MDQRLMQILQVSAGVLAGLIMLAALLLLWWRSHSPWLLLAVTAEGVSLLFRLAFAVAASAITATPILPLIWAMTALLMAAGLLGYAVDASNRRS